MKTITVFTPTYNRAHLLPRLYNSLKSQSCKDFEWLVIDDGSTDNTQEIIKNWISEDTITIKYIYKENGGLYTGYNTAYAEIETELCVCIDSDDYMPNDAIEKILNLWKEKGNEKYCGIVGLDYDVRTKKPIGGKMPEKISEGYLNELHHRGDLKQVMRTDLMKEVSPMIGFPGEKDFNPYYMLIQVLDKYPILILNENLCWVEYQIGGDSMSQGIFKQYVRSPRSFAKYRINQMTLEHGNPLKNKFRLCTHYVSSCLLSHDKNWLKNSPLKICTLLATPFGVLLTMYILYKTRK